MSWVDVSEGLDTPDWLNAIQLHDDIDANAMSMSAELLRNAGTLSLAPLMELSTINRDSNDDYAPMLDLVRKWRTSVCVVSHGDPVPTFPDDYHEIGKGYVDSIQVNDAKATIDVTGRGEEAAIIDTEITEVRTYSLGSSDDMETVIQAMLDDNMDDPPTLFVPVASSFIINEYDQEVGNLMQAITAVAAIGGYALRYRYDTDGVNKLTLFLPNREAEEGEEDWSIGPEEYLRIPLNKLDIAGVRNYVTLNFYNAATGEYDTVTSPVLGTSQSIATYRKRPITIDLSENSQVVEESRAQGMADAVCADLEFPKLQQQIESFGLWFVQLTDWVKTEANGVMY